MVDHYRETSNQIFRILDEWETVLQGLNKDILSDTSEPEF